MRTLALLALFTIGSAEVVPCDADATGTTVCKTGGGLIGVCPGANGTCNTKKHCRPAGETALSEHAQCGSSSVRTLQGKCEADGDCKYTVSVKVDYTIQGTTAARDEFRGKLSQVKTGMEAEMDQTVVSLLRSCKPLARSVTHTAINNGHLDCGKNFAGTTCDLVCDDTYAVKTVAAKKCVGKPDKNNDYDGGGVGLCEKSCPMPTNATPVAGNRVGAFTLGVSNGMVTCDGVFVASVCTLACGTGFRTVVAHPKSTSSCSLTGGPSSTPAFAAETGECESYIDVHSTANVWLAHDDDVADVLSMSDDDFIKDFMKGVAKNLNGVLPEHVKIVAVTRLDNTGERRLNETPVQIDYSVQVPTGDPEGATELLSVGAGLRGIR